MEHTDRIEFAYPATLMFKADDRFLFGREPTPRRMPDGSIVSLVYTGGTKEPHPDNVAAVIRSTDDGASWSKPELLFIIRSAAPGGPNFSRKPPGRSRSSRPSAMKRPTPNCAPS